MSMIRNHLSKNPILPAAGVLAAPVFILIASYIYLAATHGRAILWNTIIHENGIYTLKETVFYYNHFIRELFFSIFTAGIVAGSFAMTLPRQAPDAHIRPMRQGRSVALILFLYTGFIIWGACQSGGMENLRLDLFQFRTTDSRVLYGSHWQSHFLHMVFIFFFAPALAYTYRSRQGGFRRKPRREPMYALIAFFLLFLIASFAFGINRAIFFAPGVLGHQFREIITHGTVTLGFSFGALIFYERSLLTSQPDQDVRRALFWPGLLLGALALSIPLYIGMALQGVDILSHAQKQSGFLDLLASHFFEHTLDYVFVTLLSLITYRWYIIRMFKKHSKEIVK